MRQTALLFRKGKDAILDALFHTWLVGGHLRFVGINIWSHQSKS